MIKHGFWLGIEEIAESFVNLKEHATIIRKLEKNGITIEEMHAIYHKQKTVKRIRLLSKSKRNGL